MLLLLFCLNKDQFWFLLMLRTSSAEVQKKKKNVAGKCRLLSPQYSNRGDYGCKWKIFTISQTLWISFNVNWQRQRQRTPGSKGWVYSQSDQIWEVKVAQFWDWNWCTTLQRLLGVPLISCSTNFVSSNERSHILVWWPALVDATLAVSPQSVAVSSNWLLSVAASSFQPQPMSSRLSQPVPASNIKQGSRIVPAGPAMKLEMYLSNKPNEGQAQSSGSFKSWYASDSNVITTTVRFGHSFWAVTRGSKHKKYPNLRCTFSIKKT